MNSDYSQTSCKQTPSGPEKVAALEVLLLEAKNVVFVCG